MIHLSLEIMCFFPVGYTIPKCQLAHLVDGVVQFLYTLTNYLSTTAINYQEKNTEVSNYNCGFDSFQFSTFLLVLSDFDS